MPKLPRSARLALIAAGLILLIAGPRLAAPPFLPEEAALLVRHPDLLARLRAAAGATPFAPETLARLPGLLAVALAAAIVTGLGTRAGYGVEALLLTGFSPTFAVVARTFGPGPVALLLGACATAALARATRRFQVLGVVLLAIAATISVGGIVGEEAAGRLLGAWGLIASPCIPPWRLDLALPVLACALPLAWLGAGSTRSQRASRLGLVLVGAAALGSLSGRVGAAAAGAACLAPTWLHWIARGSQRLTPRLPRWPLVTVVIGAGLIGAANLHTRLDLLDPARRVAWDEAARMLAMMAAGPTRVVASPDLPASLVLYAQTETPIAAFDGPIAPTVARVLVVSHGVHGGLARPGADQERTLEGLGFRLRGELEMGELEAGYQGLLRRLTGTTPAATYLRIRRYERIRRAAKRS